ncbi:MAG TPA: arginine--tRNA ligase [Solirubrobacteraceae bacterium]|jgi:arginyl-tRNA synthetase|nr:arginine--tRNA ligase [Solirubrobacteraceae bacterium]
MTNRSPAHQHPLADLRGVVLEATAELLGKEAAGITLERPRSAQFGDYATNAALVLAPAMGAPPREIAERLGNVLAQRLGAGLERFEVAGPGFVNLFLADDWLIGALGGVLSAGDRYGAGGAAAPERVLVEFVSANPTGPLHVGHARNAAYGDSLARMLRFHGHDVEREFYINDAGSQMDRFGESIRAQARGEELPEGGYQGEYIVELAAQIPGAADSDAAELGLAGMKLMLVEIEKALASFRVEPFDIWAYESRLHEGDPTPVENALAILAEQKRTYEQDGALWLRTTEFGDDKDRVLIRSSGEHTYFASDIAYHEDRRERGYDREIDIWGADHHGYIARMKAMYAALGGDPDALELVIMQLVHLLRSGERSQMSKRAGEFVSLQELVEDIGVDAARWYLLARSPDTTVDLDIEQARKQSNENPVYYVQYAHARIVSVLAKADRERRPPAADAPEEPAEPLHESERALIQRLLAFPGEVDEAVERRAPHRLAAYVLELAQTFTAFYRDCRVVGAEPPALEARRLSLCTASKQTIASALSLLGVSAPEEM